MNATQQCIESNDFSPKYPLEDESGLMHLCTISHETDERVYRILLQTDVSRVSLEGLNQYFLVVASRHKATGMQEMLEVSVELNLRQEMSCISIGGDAPYYFTVTRKSLDLCNPEIDSSIHEAVDLALMEHRLNASGVSRASIIFDGLSCNFIKAGASALLALSTWSHQEVIRNANHLFASRLDYVREMCTSLSVRESDLLASVMTKALHCDQGLF